MVIKMNKISEIWDRTIGIEGVDTGYPKFEKELLAEMEKVRKEAEQAGWAEAMDRLIKHNLTNPKGETE